MGWIDIEHTDVIGAVAGDAAALERILQRTQEPVYNLALRFLWNPPEAEDATQEILIRIVTNLATFRGESRYSTWAYRIAVNHLLRAKKSRAERREISFREAGRRTELLDETPLAEEDLELAGEVKVACTHGMLLCLKRDYRMAFLLGTALGMPADDAAQILEISSEAFRQRLSRARGAMAEFLNRRCGLTNAAAACRCPKRVRPFLKHPSLADYRNLAGALKRTGEYEETRQSLAAEISQMEKVALLYRNSGMREIPPALRRRIENVFSNRLFHA